MGAGSSLGKMWIWSWERVW